MLSYPQRSKAVLLILLRLLICVFPRHNPANIFVTLDEHPDSINDGMIWNPPNVADATEWSDLPASRHNGACGFAFADAHAEIHRWRDATTKSRAITRNGWFPGLPFRGGKVDYQWVAEHSTIRR
jgi:prepilin-type processing-associated H-X9-DG protein